ncbi:MAG: hypothetical protein IT222_00050 [Crocinitomix sp.]|nr:hypothetical protein [Crocinitomix sp.]
MSKTTKSFEKVSWLNYCVTNKLAQNVNGSKGCARAEVENPEALLVVEVLETTKRARGFGAADRP